MHTPHYKLSLPKDEFSSALYDVSRTIIRTGTRQIIGGADKSFVIEEIGPHQQPTGNYLKVRLAHVRHKKLSEVTPRELWEAGISADGAPALLRQYGKQLPAAEQSTYTSWLEDQQKRGYTSQHIVLFLTLQAQHPTLHWDSDITLVLFKNKEMISPRVAKTLIDTNRAEHECSQAWSQMASRQR